MINREKRRLPTFNIGLDLLNFRVIMLSTLDLGVKVLLDDQGIHMALGNNLNVHFSELFIKEGLLYLNFKFRAISFMAQGIGHYISFAPGIGDIHIEVGYCLEPSLLAEIQVRLSKQVLHALVVGVDLATITKKVMSPQLRCIDYRCQFEVMGWIFVFVSTELTRAISNHFALLH